MNMPLGSRAALGAFLAGSVLGAGAEEPAAFPYELPMRKPDRPLSAAMERLYSDYLAPTPEANELYSTFKFTPLEGLDYHDGDGTISRRDPSKVIRVNGKYYVWYTHRQTATPPRGASQGTDTIPSTDWDLSEIWYATSDDGFTWQEQGVAVPRPPKPQAGWRSVSTADILVWKGKYYLYYQGFLEMSGKRGDDCPVTASVAVSPDGPWRPSNRIIIPNGAPGAWDQFSIHDPYPLVYKGKIHLYYKSDFNNAQPHVRAHGLAVADEPLGPFTKHPLNPVMNSGHETTLFPFMDGIAAFAIHNGLEHNTIQYSPDGVNFRVAAVSSLMPVAAGPYVPDAFTDTKDGRGITWGLCHITGAGERDKRHSILARFDCDLSRDVNDPAMKQTDLYLKPEAYFSQGLNRQQRAQRARADVPSVPAAFFGPDWRSLEQYRCPDWFRDAKFGIYAHWGPYSAARGTRNTDWYSRNMYREDHPNHADHVRNHGSPEKFGYKDLIPLFTAEKFSADEWVDLYVQAGARFAGPVAEHADGFAMWDSKVTPWNAKAMGPKRDVVGEMERAVRKRGLKFVASLHHQWKWGWYPTWESKFDCSNPAYAALYGPAVPPTAWAARQPNGTSDVMKPDPRPDAGFAAEWLGKVKEVVTHYKPDLLWFDNRMQILPEDVRREMVAFYYNQAAQWQRPVVLTYKEPDLPKGTATIDLERSRMPDIYPDPWLTDSSIAATSWSYATDLEYYSTDRLINDLVDIISKNGCLLLNIAPAPDGTIPEEQKTRLREMGAWLKVNGEAIYGTRPWKVFGEGPTSTPRGHLADLKFNGFTAEDVRFTRSKDGQVLYAIALGWPADGSWLIHSLTIAAGRVEGVQLIGHSGKLEWSQNDKGLKITLPAKCPGQHAFVFRLSGRGLVP